MRKLILILFVAHAPKRSINFVPRIKPLSMMLGINPLSCTYVTCRWLGPKLKPCQDLCYCDNTKYLTLVCFTSMLLVLCMHVLKWRVPISASLIENANHGNTMGV